jgi:K+-sensing histidine kinase KdpD
MRFDHVEKDPDAACRYMSAIGTEEIIMAKLAQPPTDAGAKRALAHWHRELQSLHSPVLRYALAIVSFVIALGSALTLQYYHYRDVEVPVLTLAIAVTAWYAGNGPAVVAVVLSVVCFDYFFTEPLYSLEISTRDLPYFFIFVLWGLIIAVFSAVRRRIEESLRQAQQELTERAVELEAANKELEAFAYSVSHDLRAPLRHVAGYAELLQRHASSLLDDKSRRYLKTILEAAKRMGDLIDDLLGFSRIGRAETNKTVVNLEQLVTQVVAELEQDTRGRDIAWKIGPFPVCYGDRSMLRVVFVNLLSNATKFTRNRTRAEIEIGCTDGSNNQIEVFIRDNGAGFDMQHVNKLFGVFQRLHLPEEFEGTGIGLATVQRVIHRHGGTCRAEGVVDQGATFYLTLPKG